MKSNRALRNRLLPILLLLLCFLQVNAQFTITETFKTGLNPNVVFGNSAVFTSGNVDPANEGWLRLTPSSGNACGYAYLDKSFPSTLGVVLEFEYKSWRNVVDNTYYGADGFCVYMFDASVTNFKTGGYGGSLGYAPNTTTPPSTATGLTGGYIGVGFDEYGNFASPTEGRIGGPGARCNSVTLRGPTTASATTTNRYLTHNQLQTSLSSDVNSIDYNVVTTTRPTDAQFYRRIKLTIIPTDNGCYQITAYWMKSTTGNYEQLITYTTTDIPPSNLKVGFSASTGGGFNFHEIRNLIITTPGNVRVTKRVDKANAQVGEQLTYTVDVVNDTPAPLSNIKMDDILKDGAGNQLTSEFTINSITFHNNGNTSNTASNASASFPNNTTVTAGLTNPFETISLNMAANSVSSFTIVGTINAAPTDRIITNTVSVDPAPSGITDEDLTNNTATATTQIVSSNIDFTIAKAVNNFCADATNGNTYTILVTNVGTTSSVSGQTVTVTDIIPTGMTIVSAGGTGWTRTNSGNTYSFTRSTALAALASYPLITIVVRPAASGYTSWSNTATVAYTGTESVTSNNTSNTVDIYGGGALATPVVSITNADCASISTARISNYNSAFVYTFTPSGPVVGSGGTILNMVAGVDYTVTSNMTCALESQQATFSIKNKNYWMGSNDPTTGTDWGTASNWTCNHIPESYEDVIFATVANYGSAAVNDLQLDIDRIIGNLVNATTKATIIPTDKSLTVAGTVYGSDSNPNKLRISADNAHPNGSLILNCTNQSSTDVYATVEMYSPAYRSSTKIEWLDNISDSPTNGQLYGGYYVWQYFGIPVEQVLANPTFAGSYVRVYDEALNGSSYYQKWRQLQNPDALSKFKGYEVTQNAAKKFAIQGKLVYCNQDIVLTANAGQASNGVRYGMGYNIFGNSFTSAIPIDQLTFPADVEQTVYLYNTGAFGSWGSSHSSMADPSATLAGSYKAIPRNLSSVSNYKSIPSMNGFLLLYTGAYGTQTTMTLPYGTLVKNADRQTAPRAPLSYLDIELSSTSTSDHLLLVSEPGTTPGFDNGWDGRKFFGTPTAYIYAPTPDGIMEISTNSTLIGTMFNFVANTETDYTLSIKKTNIDQYYSTLSLIDLYTGNITPLNDEVTEYTFTASNVGTTDQRFMISGIASSIDETDNNTDQGMPVAFVSQGTIYVNNTGANDATLYLFDAVGRKLYSGSAPSMSVAALPLNLVDGIYMLTIAAGKEMTSTKLIVTK